MVELSPGVLAVIVLAVVVGIFLFLYLYKSYQDFRAKQKKLNQWPPMFNACPDYWADLGEGSCQNVHNLGKCPKNDQGMLEPAGKMSFKTVGDINTPEGRRKLCIKAKECGLSWEHIDNLC